MHSTATCTANSASVWPQIKCMRILQQFPLADDPSLAGAVSAVLQRIIAVCSLRFLHSRPSVTHATPPKQLGAENVKNINKNNALQAARGASNFHTLCHSDALKPAQVLFEAVGLVILLERDRELVEQMAVQLGRFIAAKEPNTRCVSHATFNIVTLLN